MQHRPSAHRYHHLQAPCRTLIWWRNHGFTSSHRSTVLLQESVQQTCLQRYTLQGSPCRTHLFSAKWLKKCLISQKKQNCSRINRQPLPLTHRKDYAPSSSQRLPSVAAYRSQPTSRTKLRQIVSKPVCGSVRTLSVNYVLGHLSSQESRARQKQD